MTPLGAATLWLLAGGALSAGTYWAFLNTPESTAWTLTQSAILAVVSLALVGATLNGAIAAWLRVARPGRLRRAIANVSAIVPALALVLLVWWLAGRAGDWVVQHSGPINAWFIARFGWADVSALFAAFSWTERWLRWVMAPLAALSLLAAIQSAGWPAAAGAAWLGRALSPVRLLLATLWFGGLIAAPWLYLVPWRPPALPPTSVEIAFVAVKLSVAALLMAVGAALFIREAARPASNRQGI